jgi:hypothetical protein
MVHCAACGRRLTGDTGYYGRCQSPGHAYRRELCEQIVEELLAEASLGAGAIAGVAGEVGRAAPCDTALRRRYRRRCEYS